jgi:excisionase family DNA binding protein
MMKLFTEKETAEILKISYGYLKKLRLTGEIGFSRIGRAIRYRDAHLEAFIAAREVGQRN